MLAKTQQHLLKLFLIVLLIVCGSLIFLAVSQQKFMTEGFMLTSTEKLQTNRIIVTDITESNKNIVASDVVYYNDMITLSIYQKDRSSLQYLGVDINTNSKLIVLYHVANERIKGYQSITLEQIFQEDAANKGIACYGIGFGASLRLLVDKALPKMFTSKLDIKGIDINAVNNSISVDKEKRHCIFIYAAEQQLKEIVTKLPAIQYYPVDCINASYGQAQHAALLYKELPFIRIVKEDCGRLLPGILLQNTIVPIIQVPWAYVSSVAWNSSMADFTSALQLDIPTQHFFERFVRYYTQVLPIYGMTTSNNVEQFSDNYVSSVTRDHIQLNIDYPLESARVARMVRNIHTELHVSLDEVHVAFRLYNGDLCILTNQKHRSIDNTYYVASINYNTKLLVLQSSWFIKEESIKKTKSTKNNTLVIQLSKESENKVAGLLQKGQQVYLQNMDLGGTVVNILQESDQTYSAPLLVEVNVVDDYAALNAKGRCITDIKIQTRQACESKFDNLGMPKQYMDVWDRPCEYDNDCPFFQKGERGSFRGGCQAGVCEMPVGIIPIGYRKYTFLDPKNKDTEANDMRFVGDLFNLSTNIEEGYINYNMELMNKANGNSWNAISDPSLDYTNYATDSMKNTYLYGDTGASLLNQLLTAFKDKLDSSLLEHTQDMNLTSLYNNDNNDGENQQTQGILVDKILEQLIHDSNLASKSYYIPMSRLIKQNGSMLVIYAVLHQTGSVSGKLFLIAVVYEPSSNKISKINFRLLGSIGEQHIPPTRFAHSDEII